MTLAEAVENLAKAMATQASANILVEGAKELVLKIGSDASHSCTGGGKAKIRPKVRAGAGEEIKGLNKCPDCGHVLGGGHAPDCKYEEGSNDYKDDE